MFHYSQKALDHFKNPRNVGVLENPDAVGEVGSLACGQMLRLMLKLTPDGRIAEARFQAFGCASAIASASALTELIYGKTLTEAETITDQQVAEYLDGLPDARQFYANIVTEALHLAIKNIHPDRIPGVRASLDVSDPIPRRGELLTSNEALTPRVLDCRGLACPLNFVKTKICLDRMRAGEMLCILLNEEGAQNVPRSAEAEGHRVLEVTRDRDHWRVLLKKGEP